MLNVHPSLLPRWRGAAPIERAIMAGDERTGRVDHAPHRGPRQRARVPGRAASRSRRDDTYGSLAPRLAELGGELLVRALRRSAPPFAEQDEEGVTYAEKIAAADRLLDPATAGGRAGARRARAAPAHRRAPALPDGRCSASHAAAVRRATRRRRAGALQRRETGACCSAHAPGRSSCCACSPPAGGRWTRAPTCAAMPCRLMHRLERLTAAGDVPLARVIGAARLRLRGAAPRVRAAAPTPTEALQAEAQRARRARPRAGDAPRLRRGPAQAARSTT